MSECKTCTLFEKSCIYCKIILDFTIEHKKELQEAGAKGKYDLHLLWEPTSINKRVK